MKKTLSIALALGAALLFTGCASRQTRPPEPAPALSMLEKIQERSDEILENDGLAAVGIGESGNISLARNRAKAYGRRELARMLEVEMETLRKGFATEEGLDPNSELLAPFETASKIIKLQYIQGCIPQELRHGIRDDGIVTACALTAIDPALIIDTLSMQKELYTRFRASETFQVLEKKIQRYEAFKAQQ